MPTTGSSVERREDKEKQIEECQTLKEQTEDGSTVCSKQLAGADAVPVFLSPRAMSDCEGPPTGELKRIPHIHLCTFSPGCIHVSTLVLPVCVLCFYFSLSDRTQQVFKKKKKRKGKKGAGSV